MKIIAKGPCEVAPDALKQYGGKVLYLITDTKSDTYFAYCGTITIERKLPLVVSFMHPIARDRKYELRAGSRIILSYNQKFGVQ
ncbi:MAG: hypothetical protein HY514_01990 [Candidatus Aenigmarchaeota archaeon]|nr:hypothetical protein [Candidatus Aenigmarchaeota archaeon]